MDIIVVEGIHDESKIKSVFPDAYCIITNGREIKKQTIEYLQKLSENNNNIIVFTDPDSPGEKIRGIIDSSIKNCKHAFLRKKDCISANKKKIGIEHASKEAIKEALNNVYTMTSQQTITMKELFELGLNGLTNSSNMRAMIADYLNIGKPNCKSFLKRVNSLGLTKKDIEEIICKIR